MNLDTHWVKSSKRALALCDLPPENTSNHQRSSIQKLASLSALPEVRALFCDGHWLALRWGGLTCSQKICLLSLIAIDQGHLLCDPQKIEHGEKKWRAFLKCLEHTEDFYADIGGVIGYHAKVIDLLSTTQSPRQERFLPPPKIDCTKSTPLVERAIEMALKMWQSTALIIPAGGAGDRLNLLKSDGAPLPAAFLTLDAKTLLESIISDVSGCEYAAYKLTGKRTITPIAIMTSHEKDNHSSIERYLEEQNWFGREKKSFRLFCQSGVPMISSTGTWVATAPLQLLTKPGGHGVMWRLAQRLGVFDWLDRLGCQKAIVRQINNCLAGCDTGLLALAGSGWLSGKSMGFASCARQPGMAEGVNVAVERSSRRGLIYTLENIEYNELPRDLETSVGGPYLANVNLLFIDLKAIELLSTTRPLPGLTINFKTRLKDAEKGEEILSGRLESTMQNISSYLVSEPTKQQSQIDDDLLPTFAIFCNRAKILSAAKRAQSASSPAETPQQAYHDLHRSSFALLASCGIALPHWEGEMPPAVIALHPSLGPDWRIIAQKIRGGSIEKGSELRLEIAELDSADLRLSGSFHIICETPRDEERLKGASTSPAQLQGRCTLRNVFVQNEGVIDQSACNYWSQRPVTSQSLKVILNGLSEFCAENVTLRGSKTLRVPAGYRMVARQKGADVIFQLMPLGDQIWGWDYRFDHGQWNLRRLDQAMKSCEIKSPQSDVESALEPKVMGDESSGEIGKSHR